MFTWLKNIATSKSSKEDFNTYSKPKSIKTVDYKAIIPNIGMSKDFNKDKPTILIMDDFAGMAQLLSDELDRVQCCKVKEQFNILLATGSFAAFTVKDLLKEGEPPLHVAFLDITLGGVIKGKEYDGIDIAIMIKKYYPDCVIRFVTGHTLNRHNPEIFQFIKKFEDFFKVPIDETHLIIHKEKQYELYKHIINKNGNRVQSLGDAIQEYIDLEKQNAHT